jgi:cleavage stimulation factor subunit 3
VLPATLIILTVTDARVAFASIVSKLTKKPENILRAKRLYHFFHDFESKYGELSQFATLENKMAELFPEDPKLSYFASRFEQGQEKFNPTLARPVISVIAQMRPPLLPVPQIAQSPEVEHIFPTTYSPRPSASPRPLPYTNLDAVTRNSPKRPFVADSGDEMHPRKLQRGESPLKGAAGRRLDAARRRAEGSAQAGMSSSAQAPPWPTDVTFFLMALPRTELCQGIVRLNTVGLMGAIGKARLDGGTGYGVTGGYGYQQR